MEKKSKKVLILTLRQHGKMKDDSGNGPEIYDRNNSMRKGKPLVSEKPKFEWTFYDPQYETEGFIGFLNRETSTAITRNREERHQLRFREYNGRSYVIKRFSPSDNKRFGHRLDLALKSLFSSGAKRSYRGAVWLWEAGIPTIRPVAFSSCGSGFSQVGYFIYEAIEEGVRVSSLIGEMEEDDPERYRLIEQMAIITRRVHDAGYRHTDIVGHNFLLVRKDDGETMYLIDTDKTKKAFIISRIPFFKRFFDIRCLRRLRIDNDGIRHFLRSYERGKLRKRDLRIFAFWLSGGFNPRKRADMKKRLPERMRKIYKEDA